MALTVRVAEMAKTTSSEHASPLAEAALDDVRCVPADVHKQFSAVYGVEEVGSSTASSAGDSVAWVFSSEAPSEAASSAVAEEDEDEDADPLADKLGFALLVGVASVTRGPDRTAVCARRRSEILEGIGQILFVLEDTEYTLTDGVASDQRNLCLGRLAWALNMAMGLQQGALALKTLERADQLLEASASDSKPAPLSPATALMRTEHQHIERLLLTCLERVRDISRILEEAAIAEEEGRTAAAVAADRDTLEVIGDRLADAAAAIAGFVCDGSAALVGPLTPVLARVADVVPALLC